MALAQTTYDTGESSERAALKQLLSTLELEGVLIQAERRGQHKCSADSKFSQEWIPAAAAPLPTMP